MNSKCVDAEDACEGGHHKSFGCFISAPRDDYGVARAGLINSTNQLGDGLTSASDLNFLKLSSHSSSSFIDAE